MNPTRVLTLLPLLTLLPHLALLPLLIPSLAPAQSPAVLLRDIRPGTIGTSTSGFAELQGRLFFTAQPGANFSTVDLFVTDGTPAGTVPFGLPSAGVQILNGTPVAVGPLLFFLATTAANGMELWKSDGTVAGTQLVADLNPGPTNASADLLTSWRGYCFFTAAVPFGPNYHLLRSDGTAAGSVGVGGPWPTITRLKVAGDKLFFVAVDASVGDELWVLDQPLGTPRMVLDIRPGPLGSRIGGIGEWRGKAVFDAEDGVNGSELWTSDGTAAGTMLMADVNFGPGSSHPASFTPTRDYLFFIPGDAGFGNNLWQTDGTQQGTQLVPNNPPLIGFGNPTTLVAVGNVVYARGATQIASPTIDVWRMDGTPSGTLRVRGADQNRALDPMQMYAVGQRYLYFRGDDGVSGTELWRTDGTVTGTTRVVDLVPGASGSSPLQMRPLGGNLVFFAATPATGTEFFAVPLDALGQAVGSACGAPGRATTLAATDPVLGQTCALSGGNAYPGSAGILFYGAPAASPVPVGNGSCRWLLSPARFFFLATVATSGNAWSLPLPIPNDPALQHVLLRAQGVFAVTDAPGGFDLTNAANLNLGR